MASTMLTEHAKGAVAFFGRTSTARSAHADVRVVDVSVLDGRQPVYDLTVDGPPEFYANGILVHNCSDATRYAVFTHFFSKRRGGRNDVGHEDRGG
jgi:hypothetical protein